jgi:hypothetical protein
MTRCTSDFVAIRRHAHQRAEERLPIFRPQPKASRIDYDWNGRGINDVEPSQAVNNIVTVNPDGSTTQRASHSFTPW